MAALNYKEEPPLTATTNTISNLCRAFAGTPVPHQLPSPNRATITARPCHCCVTTANHLAAASLSCAAVVSSSPVIKARCFLCYRCAPLVLSLVIPFSLGFWLLFLFFFISLACPFFVFPFSSFSSFCVWYCWLKLFGFVLYYFFFPFLLGK